MRVLSLMMLVACSNSFGPSSSAESALVPLSEAYRPLLLTFTTEDIDFLSYGEEVETGDFNADGHADLVIGVPEDGFYEGRIHLYLGTAGGLPEQPDQKIDADSFGFSAFDSALGRGLAVADMNGDQIDDLVVGMAYGDRGMVCVVRGSSEGLVLSDTFGDLSFKHCTSIEVSEFSWDNAEEIEDAFGEELISIGDFDGNGCEDVVSTIPFASTQTAKNLGIIYGIWGEPDLDLTTTSRFGEVSPDGVGEGERLGEAVVGVGDYNGDGYDDMVVSSPDYVNDNFGYSGKLSLLLGNSTKGLAYFDNSAAFYNEAGLSFGEAGTLAGGDFDGDGFGDLVALIPGADRAEIYVGGPDFDLMIGPYVDIALATALTHSTLGNLGDIDGDGADDIGVGAPSQGGASGRVSVLTMLYEDNRESFSIDPCDFLCLGIRFGEKIRGGDFNGDGYFDPVISALGTIPQVSVRLSGWDRDGDGRGVGVVTPVDCDDRDEAIYEGAPEVPADGIDQNCDGFERCAADDDGDGFGGSTAILADLFCSDEGAADNFASDCNDTNEFVNPDAVERAGNLTDENCDEKILCYVDADGDGFPVEDTRLSDDMDCSDPLEFSGVFDGVSDCDDTDETRSTDCTELTETGDTEVTETGDTENEDTDTGLQEETANDSSDTDDTLPEDIRLGGYDD